MKKLFFFNAIAILMATAQYAKASPPKENYWHPLLNVESGRSFSDAQRFAALEAGVNDTWSNPENKGCFTEDIRNPHEIIMSTLTLAWAQYYKLPTPTEFISEEQAMSMLHDQSACVINHVHNFWADGTHRSLRYAKDGITGDPNFDPAHPGPNDPKENVEWDDILMWNGIPLFRWKCLNPIKTVSTPNSYNPPPNNNPPPADNGYIPKRMQSEAAGYYMNNSNTTYVNFTMPSQEKTVTPVVQKEQSGFGKVLTFLAGVATGYVGRVILDRLTGQYYQVPNGYQLGGNEIFMPNDWIGQQGGNYFIQNLPRRYYNTSSLNPVLGTNQGGTILNGNGRIINNNPLNVGSQGGTRFISYGGL